MKLKNVEIGSEYEVKRTRIHAYSYKPGDIVRVARIDDTLIITNKGYYTNGNPIEEQVMLASQLRKIK